MSSRPTLPELQQVFSDLPADQWRARIRRAAAEAREIDQAGFPILIERTQLGLTRWQILPGQPAPAAELASVHVLPPLPATGRGRLRRAQIYSEIDPRQLPADTGAFGAIFDGQLGAAASSTAGAVVAGGVGGAAGGFLVLVYSILGGGAAGLAGWHLWRRAGRRRAHAWTAQDSGPIYLPALVALARVYKQAAPFEADNPGLALRAEARRLMWRLLDPDLSEAGYDQITYQGQVLEHALGDAVRAQGTLDALTATDHTGNAIAAVQDEASLEQTQETLARLQAHTMALDDVAGQIRAVKQRHLDR